jgi:hypothetical protein
MNMDISEEAKLAIANRAQVKARARLVRDGCHTDAAMRRRLLALAAERDLPPAEYAKLMHKRIMMKSIHEFCSKHDVSLDWLIYGDLKGLLRMKQWAKQDQGMTADEQHTPPIEEGSARFLALFYQMGPTDQALISDVLRGMVNKNRPQ